MHKKTGLGLSPRVILMAITIASATGGFILGYLVGKNIAFSSLTQANPQKLHTTETAAAKPEAETGTGQITAQTALQETPPAPENQPASNGQKIQTPESKKPEPAMESDAKGKATANVAETEKGTESGTAAQQKEARAFLVQTGAFSSQSEAEALRKKLNAKGYKASVIKRSTKNNKALFKVTAGEFSRKKDAEALALRLKKTEGLNAFVSLKK